jgi:hypothetical protein
MLTSKDTITAMNRLVRQDLSAQIASGINMEDWAPEHLEAIFREHLALQASLKEVLDAIPSIRHSADPSRLQVVRNARRLVGK